MNKIQALKHMYKHNYKVRQTADRLMLIKPHMNSCDIARVCKMALGNAYLLIRQYNLKISNRRAQNAAEERRERDLKNLVPKWNTRKNVLENSIDLGISYVKARILCGKFKLKATHRNLRPTALRHIKRIKEYKAKGLNDAQISRVIGLTRERVRQLSIMKDF